MPKTSERETVIVKHISNENVEHHIKIIGAKTKRKTQASCIGLVSEFYNDVTPIQKKKPVSEALFDNENVTSSVRRTKRRVASEKPVETIPNENDEQSNNIGCTIEITPMDIYSFRTPKRSKQMSKLVLDSIKKAKNAENSSLKENEAPSGKKSSKKAKKSSLNTPLSENVGGKLAKVSTDDKNPTPLRKSKRLANSQKYGVQEVLAQQEDEDSDVSIGSDNDDEDSTDEETEQNEQNGINFPSASALYFEAHKSGSKLSATTSDRTLSRMKMPQISFSDMQTILDEIDRKKFETAKKCQNHNSAADNIKIEMSRQLLISHHRTQFKKWMFYVCHGYNILLFGFGSKRKIIGEFCQTMLPDYDKIVVNGYFPSLLIKNVLTSICDVIDDVTCGLSLQNQLEAICSTYTTDSDERHLFLIIHNIDGATLRNKKAQDVLCRLSQCPRIHIVATIDHINATLIWEQSKFSKFNWLWHDVTTFERYKDETSFENSLLLLTSGSGMGGSLALSGLLHVARSLTPNARGIFKIIAENQSQDVKRECGLNGISFSDLYLMCREKFLVNSELTLRTQLTEFLDHKLVQIKKGLDGVEYLSIPLDSATLKEYLDQAE